MRHIYFVRHGLSEMNKQGTWSGSTDTPLTDEGKLEAMAAGQELKTQNVAIDYIVASPLSRAYETAVLIAKEINYPKNNIEINPLFVERHFGALEGVSWGPDVDLDGITDIETTDTILHRARRALDYVESLPHSNILIVAHGSIGRAIRHHLHENMPYSDISLRIPNATVIQWL